MAMVRAVVTPVMRAKEMALRMKAFVKVVDEKL